MGKLLNKLFGDYSEKEIKRINVIVDKVEALEEEMKKLSDEALKNQTIVLKARIEEGETLDDILPEAFAAIREASVRVLGMRPFRVQLIGGIVLHQGRIAEMKTGEGKTLVATMPVYLNALLGKGVHVVTVNDYLAELHATWMGKLYNFMGLTVGVILHDMDNDARRQAYNYDITYGTNNEFGFDYLRDNMVVYKENMVQRELNFSIIDEVDSILIDEARTPLIISGSGDKSTEMYKHANSFVKGLKRIVFKETDDKQLTDDFEADYFVDEKAKSATLTSSGMEKAERHFNIENLSDIENMTISHHINQALKAHGTMKGDIDYVVKDGEVIIVDEFTGRLMYGRRYSDGLHQAIEAKEGVTVARESKTLATITFQNYFRLYNKLSGMTGTALTEEQEFRAIYGLDVIVIPTNKPVIRKDHSDVVYKNINAKFLAVIKDIQESYKIGQPVLVGTISIETSELLSKMLRKSGVKHNVLNAKYHDKEADIVAQAGKYKAVTIATNMAGRGTDIKLGGSSEHLAKQEMRKKGMEERLVNLSDSFHETEDQEILEARKTFAKLDEKYSLSIADEKKKVIEVGGLKIIGTERHESRRIDNQLRGRSGRQGDPGESRFFISFEDDLMRLFGSERMLKVVNALGLPEEQPIEHKMLSNAIENAQKKIEGINFSRRKSVLQYDDVMNKQRQIIYEERYKVLNGENIKSNFERMITSVTGEIVTMFCAVSPHPDYWDWTAMLAHINETLLPIYSLTKEEFNMETTSQESVIEIVNERALKIYSEKEEEISSSVMRELERRVLLRVVDEKWMDHIDAMDQLKHGIGLRAYAQKDPVIEYKKEGFDMFENMLFNIQNDSIKTLLHLQKREEGISVERQQVAKPTKAMHGETSKKPAKRETGKVGRNDPCPCGSGKKYKKCCGM